MSKEKDDVMLQTALRLGLRDIEAVQDYEIEVGDANMVKQREDKAKALAEKKAKAKKDLEEDIRSWGGLGGLKKSPWKDDPDIPLRADFLKDLSFAECAKTPQGIKMSLACLLHYDEVKHNAALKARLQAYLRKKMEEFVSQCYPPIVPLVTLNKISVRRHPVAFNNNGDPKTRMIPFTVYGPEDEVIFDAVPTESRASCCGMCGSKIPKEITITKRKDKGFVMKLCMSHWNGLLPEWMDIQMPLNNRFATVQSTTQVHPKVENNYDVFDKKGRVLGVISPEAAPVSDRIMVSLYDVDGSAVQARIKSTDYEHGEYVLTSSPDMAPDLKAVVIAVMILLLVEDLGGYIGRGENGR